MNRFFIDEEAGFQLAGIYLLKDTSLMTRYQGMWSRQARERWQELG